MGKEDWIQRDSLTGKDFKITKKTRGKRTDIFVSRDGKSSKKHDHGIIKPGYTGYKDRGVSDD